MDEVEAILVNTNIKRLDLSKNLLGKSAATFIGKVMKETIDHIEWIDLSRNCFNTNYTALNSIYTGLKKQKNLYHFCIDINLSNT